MFKLAYLSSIKQSPKIVDKKNSVFIPESEYDFQRIESVFIYHSSYSYRLLIRNTENISALSHPNDWVQDIQKLPNEDKNHLLYLIDNVIQNVKTKQAFS